MTPEQVRQDIQRTKEDLDKKVKAGKLNESFVTGHIEHLAREGARHNGIPEAWREYLPKT